MKKLLLVIIAMVMLLCLTACGEKETQIDQATEPIPEETIGSTPNSQPDWEYDQAAKTLYVNVDMGAFEPDALDFDGTTSNAPWADFLPEIENIVISDDVKFIGEYAFAFCPNLKNVQVGKNVTVIDFRGFFKCGDWDNNSNIEFHFNSTPNFGDDVFGYTWDNPNVMIYVPDDKKDYWADYIMQKGEMKLDGYEMNLSFGKDDVLFSTLMNPQELFYAGGNQINVDDFGSESERRVDDEGMIVFAGDQGTFMPLNTRLRDFGDENRPQQAILMRFQPKNVINLNFIFIGMGEFVISFEEDELYFSDVSTGMNMPFSDYLPNSFYLDGMAHYYIFAAVDADANLKVMVWQDGNPENQAYYEYCLYQGADNIFESNWQMSIGFYSNEQIGQFNIFEYWVYTFEGFMDGTPHVVNQNVQPDDMQGENNDMQDANDNDDGAYGPLWTINIGGNFDIMSDMVWQSADVQDLNIGSGDTFKGYVLKDLMDMSGNDSETARVVFGDDGGSDVEVNPTYDAYIVYMMNGEFLGGPYLLSIDGLSEFPVIEVQVD